MRHYRLSQDFRQLLEGSVLDEVDYNNVYFAHKLLFEIVTEDELKSMIKWDNEKYCQNTGIEFMLFYNQKELNNFLDKINP